MKTDTNYAILTDTDFLGQVSFRCKVQAYICIYSLHLAPKLKY